MWEVREERTCTFSITLDASPTGGKETPSAELLPPSHPAAKKTEPFCPAVSSPPSRCTAQVQPQESTIMSGMSVLTMLLSRS